MISLLLLLLSIYPFPGPGQTSGGGGGSFTCGNDVITSPSLNATNNIAVYTPCTTGANPGGYSVSSVQIYSGAAGGKIFSAIYNNTTSGCGTGTNCPDNPVCSDTTGVTAAANDWTIDTPSGCGTLTANTTYWIGENGDNASHEYAYKANVCPAPIAFTSNSVYATPIVAGVWGSGIAATINDASNCYIAKMILTLL